MHFCVNLDLFCKVDKAYIAFFKNWMLYIGSLSTKVSKNSKEKSSMSFFERLLYTLHTSEKKKKEYLRKIGMREPNEKFQEKHEKELERSCNFKKEIANLKETMRNKENELDELRSKLYTMTNAEQTPLNLNNKKQKKKRIGEFTKS